MAFLVTDDREIHAVTGGGQREGVGPNWVCHGIIVGPTQSPYMTLYAKSAR